MLCLPLILMLPVVSLRDVHAVFYNASRRDVRHSSCRLRLVRQIADPPLGSSIESFVLDDIEYKLCRYHVTWDEALVFCSSHKAHLATLDTEEKTAFVVQAIASSSSVAEDYWVGARKYYRGSWTWNSNQKKLSFERDLISNIPIWYPGYESNDVHCLTIDRSGHDSPIFIPRACNQRRPFICQRDNERNFDNKIRMVAASRIGDQEFRLYSGRATWAEAVVQCRQEGLQIGEVNTVEEARALAHSMLRNRPEGIENAWIGGYTRKDDPNTWRWLASGEKIDNNDMWRRNFNESVGGCLLLDRHVCESPVYVETMCDRKRDVLCQKPPKKRVSKYPVAVFVDGCPYWIGFYPVKWSDAKRSCEAMNASLVVLDSPKTIAHMMSLMLDNRAELRHIWTDGSRVRNAGEWQWDSTGERIPDFDKSFIPWCPDDGFYSNETDCLNLDRENRDSPLVYGLSCHEKQSYICQPRIGNCVFHKTPATKSTPSEVTEDITKATPFTPPFYDDSGPLILSKVTAPYPMSNDNYGAIQTTIDGENNHLTDLLHWKPGESVSEKNSSTDHLHLARYLKPLSRFTLPSLPQFGIKVVSAAETTLSSRSMFDDKRRKMKTYPAISTSLYGVTPPIIASTALPSFATARKSHIETHRKSSKWPLKSTNFSVTSNLSGNIETTISSIPISSTTAKIFSKIPNISGTKLLSVASKNSSLKSTSTVKVTTTLASVLPDDPSLSATLEDERAKKFSVKTTRDLNPPNSTRIASTTTTTTNTPKTTKNKPTHSFQRAGGISSLKDFIDTQPKPVVVESFPVNAARPNTTLMPRRKQKVRTTTEATPYDAIDADYYNNYEVAEEISKGKGTTDEDARDSVTASNEYSEDYDTILPGKLQTRKKTKQTSTSSIRKSQTTGKSFRSTKVPKVSKVEEIDKEDDETAEETEDNDEISKLANSQSVPIAAQLSKNLEAALVNMMKQGVERRKNEKSESAITFKSAGQREVNVSNVERSAKGSKTTNTENWFLRPYYAFEGPMIVGLSEDSNLGGEIERTGEKGGGRVREFKFIGKKMSENPSIKKLETGKFVANETRRQMKNQAFLAGDVNPGNNMPGVSISGLPIIQPNDPNSLVQLGRYFKNKFVGFESDGRQNSERLGNEDRRSSMTNNMREDRLTNDQRRYGMSGPNTRPRLRYRPRPGGREDESRRKWHTGSWEKQRRPLQQSDSNYYEGRRLYPRGYDFYESSMPRQAERRNEERWREEQDRLGVAWPERNFSNSQIFSFDEQSEVVSPRTFPAPIRTTRSFHEDPAIRQAEPVKLKQFPEFRLSKLVKEVKIDLDQRLLRKYLEGFARKIARKDSAREDDWKSTWRQLLGQMLTVLDRMNINVNGDVMKLRVGSDERENKLSPSSSVGHSRTREWNSGLRKQRKDSINPGTLKQSSSQVSKKINESAKAQDSKMPSNDQFRRVSPNSLQDKIPEKIKDSKLGDGQTTDSYRRYAYGDSVTKSPVEEKMIGRQKNIGRPLQSAEINLLPANNVRNGAGSMYDNKFVNNALKISSHREERTARPTLDHQFPPRQIGNNPQRANWFQPKYPNFNNSQIVLGSPPSMIPRLSTVFGYQPVMPQLHHRILFPGWTGIRVLDPINRVADKSAVLKGEYLPKGTLSRIVGSEHKNEHFGDHRSGNSPDKYDSRASTTTPRMDNNGLSSPKGSFDYKNGSKLENESLKENNLVDNIPADRGPGTENRKKEAWRRVGGEVGRNEFRNGDFSRYYNNERYFNESEIGKMDKNKGEILEVGGFGEEDSTDEYTNPREDYEQKPVWSPAHHLTKALELSLLRKFGTNPSNSLRSKNLVARSTKNSEAERVEIYGDNAYVPRHEIEENLERLNEEPSIVSLRMLMDPDKRASLRTLRQSQVSPVLERRPRTVELRVQFSGKEETGDAVTERINEANGISNGDRRNSRNNQTTFRHSSMTNQGLNLRATKRRPLGFIDKDRRRALINRLRERSRNYYVNYPRAYPRRGENSTVINNTRDRKSRTIVLGGKNLINYENSSKDYAGVKHHIATVLRSFDEKNLTGKEQDKWRKSGSYGKEFGIDWTGQAASLFTDLKESSDEFTLYIDLTLGRVGSKTRNKGRSRG